LEGLIAGYRLAIEEALRIMIVLGALEKAAQTGRTEDVPTLEEVLSY